MSGEIYVGTVGELVDALMKNCSRSDELRVKLWNTANLRDVYIRTEDKDGYSLDGYVIISADM
jgi:hypothetical protein